MGYKFKTVKGNSSLTETPFNTARIKNERIMSKKETYTYLAGEVGGKRADHASAWKGVARAIMLNADNGNAARVDGLGVFRNVCKGAFEGSKGPWERGKNYLEIQCSELNEFKNALRDVVPVNDTQGDRPAIKSVLNTVECVFEGVSLEPGEYKLVVFTRCGEAGDNVSVKSASRVVNVKVA